MERKIKTYRDLDIWNLGLELVKQIYKLTENFPKAGTIWISQPNETLRNIHTVEYSGRFQATA